MRQVALVTGSSRGIGLATAEALAEEGFAIALNGPQDDDELRAAHAKIKAMGAPVVSAPFDVSDLTQHAAQLDMIEKALGPLTTLVNNAGVGVLKRGDLLDVTEASWDRCLSINTKAMFFLSQAFAKKLIARERPKDLFHAIINVTSANAHAVAVQRAGTK
ncbi:MAG: SDR family NAD(P)-dependent oxidoreductase [Hyphomicrobiales bacterium]